MEAHGQYFDKLEVSPSGTKQLVGFEDKTRQGMTRHDRTRHNMTQDNTTRQDKVWVSRELQGWSYEEGCMAVLGPWTEV